MRFILSIVLVAVLCGLAELLFPWWSAAVVAFVLGWLVGGKPARSFAMGFCGVGVLWLAVALLHDIANEHILSQRMATLFTLPNYSLFIVVTVFVGELVGGMAAWSASLLRNGLSKEK